MKTLFLLRHAKAAPSPSWDGDFDRALADRGRRDAPAIGALMRDEGRVPTITLCSSARRAVETWRLVARQLGVEVTEVVDDTLYLATPEHLLETAAAGLDAHAKMMIVGHNPGLHELALVLAGDGSPGAIRRLGAGYPTGALSELSFDVARWSDLRPKSGRLERLVFPRDIAAGE